MLTNDDLKFYAECCKGAMSVMARELLALRVGGGDDEVIEEFTEDMVREFRSVENEELRQQLREAREEIEESNKAIVDLQSRIETLQRERDEARRQVEQKQNWMDGVEAKVRGIAGVTLGIDTQNTEAFFQIDEIGRRIESLNQKLSEAVYQRDDLKDVVRYKNQTNDQICRERDDLNLKCESLTAELTAIRNAIASRDEEKKRADEAEHAMKEAVDVINEDYQEVVGLLVWLSNRKCNGVDTMALLKHAAKFKEPFSTRILQIVEGEDNEASIV